MAITFQSVTTAVTNTASLAVAYPASISAGDLLLAIWAKGSEVRTLTGEPADFGTHFVEATLTNRILRAYLRIATGGESGTPTWNLSSGGNQAAAILRYTVSATPSVDDSDANTGNGTTATAPASTTTVADTKIIRAFAMAGPSGVPTYPATKLAAFQSATGAAGVRMGITEADQVGIGSTGTADATFGTAVDWLALTIAIKEAVGGGGQPFRGRFFGVPHIGGVQRFGKRGIA